MADNLQIKVTADTKQAEKNLNDVEKSLGFMGKQAVESAKKLATVAAAGFALKKVGEFALLAAEKAEIQNKAIAKLEQQLKNTGNAAGFTSKELQNIAADLQKLTNVGDEEILKSVTNQLLTFGNVSGEVFKRAQVAVLDLSETIGTDLTSQSIQLGKALNDPIAGIGALSRVGIQFSKTQKETIKDLVNQNNLFEAQSIILDEVEKYYGGTAKAAKEASSGIKELSNAWGDLLENIGNTRVVNEFTNAIKGWAGFIQNLADEERELASVTDLIIQRFSALSKEELNLNIENAKKQIDEINEKAKKISEEDGSLFFLDTKQEKRVKELTKLIESAQKEIEKRNSNESVKREQEYKDELKFLDEITNRILKIESRTVSLRIREAKLEDDFFKSINDQLNQIEQLEPMTIDEDVFYSIKDAYNSVFQDMTDIEGAFFSSFNDSVNSSFGNFIDKMIESDSFFGKFANNFLKRIGQMITQALILASINYVSGGGFSFASSLKMLAGKGVGLKQGGSFENIPKMAEGGSFSVPQGYPNDSALVRVQSGERIDVTPSGRNSSNDRPIQVNSTLQVNGEVLANAIDIVRTQQRFDESPRVVG